MTAPTRHTSFCAAEAEEHEPLTADVKSYCVAALSRIAGPCSKAIAAGNKLLFLGNGGSAADAQHLAAELSVRSIRDPRAITRATSSTGSAVPTGCGNDLRFNLIGRQIKALGKPGDVAFDLATYGNCASVIRTFEHANQPGIGAVTFTRNNGGKAAEIVHYALRVPSFVTARIQEMDILLLGRILCAESEHQLGLA